MNQPSPPGPRRAVNVTGVVSAILGLVVLVAVVRQVGLVEIARDIRQVGWGLVLIVAFGGARFLLRAAAWRLCLDPPHTLRLKDAFAAVICGDAIGNLTPFGPLVGEPAKAAFVRGRVALAPALTALAIENVLYTLSAAAMIGAGMIALLVRFQLPPDVRGVGELAIAATSALFLFALWMLWRQPALISRALGVAPPLRKHAARVRQLEEEIYTFASRHRGALPGLAAAEIGFHVLGVAELYLTLWLLSTTGPTLLYAFLFETANRLITVVFKVVPLRLGVDEVGTAWFATLIGVPYKTGLALAIIRKFRMVSWSAAGAVLLIRAGLSGRARSVQIQPID
ncbi:MAG TPA: lysylphosphatidylglycerol synthase domain-containing protein [Vicinamibacterales bacterium]|nr:lysylphosphatidylglycerol synthase domain-containing protein [Vicinamibacterales bacterium]